MEQIIIGKIEHKIKVNFHDIINPTINPDKTSVNIRII